MIQGNHKLFLTLIIIFSLISCQRIKDSIGINSDKPVFSTTENNELTLTWPDGRKQVLSSEGIDYNPHISPDNRYIAIDLTKFSNLQITRLFKRKDNKYIEIKNLSSAAWKEFSKDKKLQIERIINPRSRVIDLTNISVKIGLSGISEENEDISAVVKLKLEN